MSTPSFIDIGKDYSPAPAGRFPDDGPFNGEDFRKRYLVPAINAGPTTVKIDSVEGFGSSFLEESFGGLVRYESFTEGQLKQLLTIECTDPSFSVYERSIWKHISEAIPENGAST